MGVFFLQHNLLAIKNSKKPQLNEAQRGEIILLYFRVISQVASMSKSIKAIMKTEGSVISISFKILK